MKLSTGLLALAMTLTAGAAMAEEMKFSAELTGAAEVPPVETSATGMIEATFDSDSKMLSWEVTSEGLSGDATAAHFHGPAAEGENAGPVVPVPLDMLAEGSAELTDKQAQQLQDGMLYFNIHTAANPGGELRGQMTEAE